MLPINLFQQQQRAGHGRACEVLPLPGQGCARSGSHTGKVNFRFQGKLFTFSIISICKINSYVQL